MYIIAIMLAAMMVGWVASSQSLSHQAELSSNVQSEVFSSDFLEYRKSVIDFKSANPTFSGAVAITQLLPYLKWGDVLTTPNLNNIYSGGNLFIWHSGGVSHGSAYLVFDKLGGGVFVGFNRSGFLWSLKGSVATNTGILLPSIIPDGAFVVFGE